MFNINFLARQKRQGGRALTNSIKRNIADFLAYKNGLVRGLRNATDFHDRRITTAEKYADYEMKYRQYPKKINIIEVGPTVGLGKKRKALYRDVKVDFINRLNNVGFSSVQVVDFSKTFFSRNTKDDGYVNRQLDRYPKPQGVINSMVVRSFGLYDRETINNRNINEIVLNIGVTDAYNRLYSQKQTEGFFKNVQKISRSAQERGLKVRGGVYGDLKGTSSDRVVHNVVESIQRLDGMGFDSIDVADTSAGVGSRRIITDIVDKCLNKGVSSSKLSVQLRNSEGDCLLTLVECLDRGVVTYKTCVMGLETDILATERLINFCKSNAIECGDIDIDGLVQTSFWINRFFKF